MSKFPPSRPFHGESHNFILEHINLEDCRTVEQQLNKDIKTLAQHLENKDFAVGPSTIGSELEIALIDKKTYCPAMINLELCEQVKLKNNLINIQPELSKFCLEYNGPVILPNKQPLTNLANEMELLFDQMGNIALTNFNADLVPIGIIPTLNLNDLTIDAMTPYGRYYAIDQSLRLLRHNEDFELNINGENPLNIKWCNTLLGGVNASYQVHLRVNPAEFNELYNAAQLAAAFVLAVSGNSPLLFGNKLWEETRIAIFEQAVNQHHNHQGALQEQHRVAFGRGWIKDGPLGLLKETCQLFYPILPINNYASNNGPDLTCLMKHNSSVWPWNRAIYDNTCGGHFRIEMRYLPAGPTIHDMVMNAGFMLGLTKALSNNINELIDQLAFKYAQYNFYQAAEHGLKASCMWPNAKNNTLKEVPILNLLDQMLDSSAFGLQQLGVSELEINAMQSTIRSRYINKQTGAIWQRKIFDNFVKKYKLNKKEALKEMFKLYINLQKTNLPVSSWEM